MRLCRHCKAQVTGHRSERYCKDECRKAARKEQQERRMSQPGALIAAKKYMHAYKSTPEFRARRKELRAAKANRVQASPQAQESTP